VNYAVLVVPDFALHALRRSDPTLCGRAVALVAGDGRKARVTQASPEAHGVAPGLAATLAMSRCPGIILRPHDPGAQVEAHRLLVAAAFTLCPRVESTASGCCTVDLRGADAARTEALMRLRVAEFAVAGLPLRIGAGATPLLASYAAQRAEPVLVVGDTAGFLAPLPLAFAEPAPGQEEILRGWGITTLGGLTALPKSEVGRRLGADGALLWERAAGEATRVLRHVEPARSFAAEWTYEPPVESTEPLFFKLRRYAERIALELRGAGFVAEKLSLTLLLEDETDHRREFRLPEPGADVDGWLRVLNSYLEGVRTDARVAGVRLVAAPARPPEKQDGLFDTGLRDPASFWENIARIAAIVGDDRVGTPACADTHRPDAFVMERPAEAVAPSLRAPVHPEYGPTLRRFRPPWPVRVVCDGNSPARLEGGRLEGEVRAALGPWLSSGDWWKPQAWAAETWQVELAAGGIYQLARTADGWCVEGMLD
jgi:protein ImuB